MIFRGPKTPTEPLFPTFNSLQASLGTLLMRAGSPPRLFKNLSFKRRADSPPLVKWHTRVCFFFFLLNTSLGKLLCVLILNLPAEIFFFFLLYVFAAARAFCGFMSTTIFFSGSLHSRVVITQFGIILQCTVPGLFFHFDLCPSPFCFESVSGLSSNDTPFFLQFYFPFIFLDAAFFSPRCFLDSVRITLFLRFLFVRFFGAPTSHVPFGRELSPLLPPLFQLLDFFRFFPVVPFLPPGFFVISNRSLASPSPSSFTPDPL